MSIPAYPTYPPTPRKLTQNLIMDVYTTSFTYPRSLRHSHSPASSLDFQPDIRNTDSFATTSQHLQQKIENVSVTSDADAIQKLAMMAMSLHGCHVSYFMVDQGKGWNFHITGAYQQVMITRGLILKECPIQVSRFPLFFLFSPP